MDTGRMTPDRMRLLRVKAEAFLRGSLREAAATPVEDTRTLIQDLQLYQIELEMQNEELRGAHLALAETRDRYLALYDFAPVGYLTVDDAGVIKEANLTAADLLQIDRDSLMECPLTSFVAPTSQEAYEACWAEARADSLHAGPHASPHASDVELQLDNLRRCYVRLELRRVGPADRAPCWRLILTDVTARHQLDADRARLQLQMQQTQHLHSLQVLAGGVAHDFNNVLTVIVGSTAMALETLSAGAPIRPYLEEIGGAAAHAVTLTDQMLAYAGRTTIAVRPINVSTTIREMEPLLHAAVRKGTTIKSKLVPGLPSVVANRTEIEQVVMNVVLNASEALDRSGVVRLRTYRVVLRDRDLAAMTHAEDAVPGIFVGVDISDAGIGMTGETRERMFEPFFTTKVAGRGLGLAAVLGIVNRHRGAVDVGSHPGRGTRMRIYLPATTDEAADQPIMPALITPVGHCCLHGTALVVDDERGVRWMALTILSRAGMRVLEAADGRQAIDACKEYGSAIDVILLDLNMPGPSTSVVMHGVRRYAPAACIILSSGYPADGTTLPAGATAFLQKPYTPGLLAETVRLSL